MAVASTFIEGEYITNLLERTLTTTIHGYNSAYRIFIGKRKNNNYVVINFNSPRFCFEKPSLFEALDQAQNAVDFYTTQRVSEAKANSKTTVDTIVDSQRTKPLLVTRVATPESNVNLHECRFCGRKRERLPCMNTRDCEDTTDKICQAALLLSGGGEYSWRQKVAHQLFQLNQLPKIADFKQQVQEHNMTFVDLANKCLRKEKHDL